MKRIISAILLLCPVLSLLAQSAEDEATVWWGYWHHGLSVQPLPDRIYGQTDVGIRLTAGNDLLQDGRIHGLRFYITDKQAVVSAKVWVSKKQFSWGSAMPDLAVKEVPLDQLRDVQHDGQPTEVLFDEPVDVLPSQSHYANVYAGFTIEVNDAAPSPCYAMSARDIDHVVSNSCFYGWKAYDELYGPLAMQLLVSGARIGSHAVAPTVPDGPVWLAGQTVSPELTFASQGTTPVESLDVQVSIDGIAQSAQRLEVVPTASELDVPFVLPVAIQVPSEARTYDLQVAVVGVNGQPNEAAAPAATTRLTALSHEATRRVVMEEFTGTWCPNCPRGMVGLQLLDERFGDRFIGIAIHDDDPMEVAAYNRSTFARGVVSRMGGRPSCSVDRAVDCDPYGGTGVYYHFGADEVVAQRLALPTVADVEMTATWSGTDVACSVATTFCYASSDAPYALALVLVADSLTGSSNSWLQVNGLVGRTDLDDDLDEFVYGDKYMRLKYNHVAIAVAGADQGIGGSIAAPLVADEPQHFAYAFDLAGYPLVQDPTLLHAVALLLDTRTGEVVTAARCHVENGELTAVGRPVMPAARQAVRVFAADGRRVSAAGVPGVYLLRKADGSCQKVVRK